MIADDAVLLTPYSLYFSHFSPFQDGDYHNEMNSRHFLEWFEERLLPALQEPSVIIIDNASYHNTRVEGTTAPTSNNRKAEMQEWLTSKGIEWDSGMLKVSDIIHHHCNVGFPLPGPIIFICVVMFWK